MAVGSWLTAKSLQNTFQPLLLTVFVFKDSKTSPTKLRISSHNLSTSQGGFAPSITGFPEDGQDFLARLINSEIAATQAMSDNGIDVVPTVDFELADADKAMWAYERNYGFKGAKVYMYFVFWNVGLNDFSSNWLTIFVGTCGSAMLKDNTLSVKAVSRMNMNQIFLPHTRIQKRCPWVFPMVAGMSSADKLAVHNAAADDRSSPHYRCGYSYLSLSTNARGNPQPAGGAYTDCNYTLDNCLDRLGYRSMSNPYTGGYAPIEKDLAGKTTGRFGGIQWDQPARFQSRGYGQKSVIDGFNAINEGKYNDYIPMGWGTYWVDPVVLNIVGDANFTRMEVLVCAGEVSKIRKVIVNDIDVEEFSSDPAIQKQQIALQLSWTSVTTGGRDGRTNGDTIYDHRGDVYGSMKVLSITVPRQLTPSSSIPRIRVLLDGPKVRVYSDTTTYTEAFSTNNSWCYLDMLVQLGWRYEELDIQTFIDYADYCDQTVTYNWISGFVNVDATGAIITHVSGNNFGTVTPGSETIINGVTKTVLAVNSYTEFTITSAFPGALSNVTYLASGLNSHPRFKFGLGLTRRITGSDLLRQARNSGRSIIIPSSQSGLLQVFAEKTLGAQQPSAVSGSNYNTSIKSFDSDGSAKVGYVAFKFDETTILKEGGQSTLTLDQPDIKDSPNRISFPFYDEDNLYQSDSLTLVDSEDVARVERPVDGSMAIDGLLNYDQSKRTCSTYMARMFRGNPRNDTGGTYIVRVRTSFNILHLRLGHIVLVDYSQIGVDADLETGASVPITGFLARVMSIKPDHNFRTATVTLHYHNDIWFIDSYQQNGFQEAKAQFRDSLVRPSFPWSPFEARPIANDAFYYDSDYQMGIMQRRDLSGSNQPLQKVDATGKMPINIFAKSGLRPPTIGIQGTTATTGGNFIGGRRYYFQVCARDASGAFTAPSDPSSPCVIDIPAGTDTNTAVIPISNWPDGAVEGYIFGGTSRTRMTNQGFVAITPPINPDSITITDYLERSWGMPDVECNSIGVHGKLVHHVGTIGAEVLSQTSTTIKLSLFTDNQFTTNQFAPSGGFPYYIFLLGLKANGIPKGQRRRILATDAGTVAVTNNWDGVTDPMPLSSDIVGTGTSWTSDMVGDYIYIATELGGNPFGFYGVVMSVDDSTHMTISGPMEQDSGSGLSYQIFTEASGADQPLPVAAFAIDSNDGDTFTIAGGQSTANVLRGDGTTGLLPGDVIGVSIRPDVIGADSIGSFIQDVNLANAMNPLLEAHVVTDAANATPIVITTEDNHGLLERHRVYIQGCLGNTAANGVRYAKPLTDTTFELYDDSDLTSATAGNGAYTGSGQVQRQLEGLTPGEEKGRELYCIFGTGNGLGYSIKDNSRDKIWIEGEFMIQPDQSSVFVILGPSWEFSTVSSNINNQSEKTPITFSMDVPNYSGQTIFVQSFTRDGGGHEAFRSLCPWRMIYMYGSSAGGSTGVAAVHITKDGTLAIGSDLGPITRPSADFRSTAVTVEVKEAPVGADLTVEIYLEAVLWMTLVIAAGATTQSATSGQVSSAATITAGSNIRVDVTTVGTTTPGSDLSVSIYSN